MNLETARNLAYPPLMACSILRIVTAPADLVFELHRRRRELRVRQRELAKRIGVDKSAISRWELRKTSPGLGSLCAWAEELGLEIKLVPVSPTR